MRGIVMLIDESEEVRERARLALDEGGFEVVEAANGRDAAELLRCTDVGLIVCGVDVPRLGAENLVGRGRRAPPLILTSEEGGHALVVAAKACGASGWMAKPLEPTVLVAAARRMFRAA